MRSHVRCATYLLRCYRHNLQHIHLGEAFRKCLKSSSVKVAMEAVVAEEEVVEHHIKGLDR